MRITVYCGTMTGNSPVYEEAAEELGNWIGSQGHTLVYGGGCLGLMGIVSDAVLKAGGDVIGIIPQFLAEREISKEGLTELHVVDSMPKRKTKMIELGDAFVSLPGGPGTVEEVTEVISLLKLARKHAPCILYNIEGFYNSFLGFYDDMLRYGFMTQEERNLILEAKNIDEVADLVWKRDDYKPWWVE
ncbi:MAG: TIGR00730 family Rossman fold protein [Eggerthellaceae bacterium]|jgi:uncharacterized protein (TIGR00730 family)